MAMVTVRHTARGMHERARRFPPVGQVNAQRCLRAALTPIGVSRPQPVFRWQHKWQARFHVRTVIPEPDPTRTRRPRPPLSSLQERLPDPASHAGNDAASHAFGRRPTANDPARVPQNRKPARIAGANPDRGTFRPCRAKRKSSFQGATRARTARRSRSIPVEMKILLGAGGGPAGAPRALRRPPHAFAARHAVEFAAICCGRGRLQGLPGKKATPANSFMPLVSLPAPAKCRLPSGKAIQNGRHVWALLDYQDQDTDSSHATLYAIFSKWALESVVEKQLVPGMGKCSWALWRADETTVGNLAVLHEGELMRLRQPGMGTKTLAVFD